MGSEYRDVVVRCLKGRTDDANISDNLNALYSMVVLELRTYGALWTQHEKHHECRDRLLRYTFRSSLRYIDIVEYGIR